MTDIRGAERAGSYPMTDALDKALMTRQDELDAAKQRIAMLEDWDRASKVLHDEMKRERDESKQRIAELERDAAHWKDSSSTWMKAAGESYQAGFLACQKAAVGAARHRAFATTRDAI